MKVATIVGTRPEIIRLSRTIAALDDAVDHQLIHTGQNYDYELNEIFFEDLELRAPDHYLNAAGETSAETIGAIISRADQVLQQVQPDAVLMLGDTNSCLAAIPAKRRKIPIFHMEAGNRCFDQRVPEEINRRIVDHISDINMPYSEISREYLLREGLPPQQVIKTGSPMFEVLHHYLPKIQRSSILDSLSLQRHRYFVVSAHREENIDSPSNFQKLLSVINSLGAEFSLPVIVSTHPRTRKRFDAQPLQFQENVHLLKPLRLSDYVSLQMNSFATLSDSGTITEESSILSFPAINLRQTHERPEGMEEAAVMLGGLEWDRIREMLRVLASESRETRTTRMVDDYNVTNVSQKVVRIILSYTDYINRVVWSKS